MKLNHERFRSLAAEAGATPEQLAEALPKKTGRRKEAGQQVAAVRNWLAGRDHPRASAADIGALAGVLGTDAKAITRYVSTYRFSRSSPRKARLIADLIRGRRFDEAETLLRFSPKRAAGMTLKALRAAQADAEAAGASPADLVITESRVDEGPIIKRFRPKDRGRAHPIQKKTSHIVVGVEEIA